MVEFDPTKPFNDLPPLPPRADVETKAVLKKAIDAGRTLAELKGLGETIPNQALLVNSIVLQEAKASSEIENIVTTNDALFKAFTAKTRQIDSATREVLRYREALWSAYEGMRERPILSTNLFVSIAQTIKQHEGGIRSTPGTTISNDTTGEVIYTPPEGESIIRDKLKKLEEFIHADDNLEPLVKMALIHYQFEAIHKNCFSRQFWISVPQHSAQLFRRTGKNRYPQKRKNGERSRLSEYRIIPTAIAVAMGKSADYRLYVH